MKSLLKEYKLDCVLIYANAFDDRYMRAITGTYSVLQNYIMITKKKVYLSEARYLIEDIGRRTNVDILSAECEDGTIYPLLKKLGKQRRIGIIGGCKYKDITVLDPSDVIDLSDKAYEIIQFKSDDYIKDIYKYAKKLKEIMDNIRIKPGWSEYDVAIKISKKVIENKCKLAFPICVTSGRDLLKSTSMLASNKKIRDRSLICIDMGIERDIYKTDRTRMYFCKNTQAKKLYRDICNAHWGIISKALKPGMKFRELVAEYIERFIKIDGVKEVLEEDFGHGIGFGLHEAPMVEQSQGVINKNMVFTLEPTVITEFGRMRVEDMVGIYSNGKVVTLTR